MLVGVFLILQALLNFRRERNGIIRTAFWVVLWSVIIVLFFNPSLALLTLPILTTQDMVMSVLVIGLLVAFLLISQIYQQSTGIERKLTELIQNLAINNYIKEIENRVKESNE
jgi:hypothetical protein